MPNKTPQPQKLQPGYGARLREARKLADLSASAAAQRAFGRKRSAVEDLELEKSSAESWHVERLAAVYGVSPDWIRTGDPALRPEMPAPAPRDAQLTPAPEGPDPCYRVLCPTCGASLDPRTAREHMVQEHASEDPAGELEAARRDPAPWFAKAKYLTDLMDEGRRKGKDKSITSAERIYFDAQHDEALKWLEELKRIGPETFRFNPSEWPPREG